MTSHDILPIPRLNAQAILGGGPGGFSEIDLFRVEAMAQEEMADFYLSHGQPWSVPFRSTHIHNSLEFQRDKTTSHPQ